MIAGGGRLMKVCDHTLLVYSRYQEQPIVLDCGGNLGHFANWAANSLGARVFSFEADPALASRLRVTDHITVLNAAVADRDGTVTLFRSAHLDAGSFFNNGSSLSEIQVPSRSIESFVREHNLGKIDLLKIDIEGWEVPVLETIPEEVANRIAQITCEFHDFLDKKQIPRIKRIIQDFKARGWFVMNMAIRTYGDVLFINPQLVKLPWLARLEILLFKYTSALSRYAGRFCKVKR